jgi:hypothetical protein
MSDPTIADDKLRPDCAPPVGVGEQAGVRITVSRALSGPLAALGAIRYELGRDQVWVIGRLPEAVGDPVLPERRSI